MPELEKPVITAIALMVVVEETVNAAVYCSEDVVGSTPLVV
jgi:hypothetical protein